MCCLQNRSTASEPNAAGQQSYMAYEDYQMLTATPGQNITLTWPRTATPDGTVADGSETVWVYFYNDSSINEGRCLISVPTAASKMHQSAGLHKHSGVCVPVAGFDEGRYFLPLLTCCWSSWQDQKKITGRQEPESGTHLRNNRKPGKRKGIYLERPSGSLMF